METPNLDLLKKVKKVNTPDDLFDKIMQKVNNRKQNGVSWHKIAAAACIIFSLSYIEIQFIAKNIQAEKPLNTMVEINNNNLYNE